jgi:hypothetical protein
MNIITKQILNISGEAILLCSDRIQKLSEETTRKSWANQSGTGGAVATCQVLGMAHHLVALKI